MHIYTPTHNCIGRKWCDGLAYGSTGYDNGMMHMWICTYTPIHSRMHSCARAYAYSHIRKALSSCFITHGRTQVFNNYIFSLYTISRLKFYVFSHAPILYTLIEATEWPCFSHTKYSNTDTTLETSLSPR